MRISALGDVSPALNLALTAAGMNQVLAQAGGSSSSGSEEEGSDSAMDSDNSGDDGSLGMAQLMKELQVEGYTVLTRRRPKFWSAAKTKICNNQPFLLSKDGEANGNCLPVMTANGFSCTCIKNARKNTGAAGDGYVFRVTKKIRTKGRSDSLVLASKVLEITHIAPMFFSKLPSITIIAEGPTPESIPFLDDVTVQGAVSDPAIEAAQNSLQVLTSVWLQNLDLSKSLNSNFFPSSVTNLTLINCNIGDGKTGFLKQLTMLESLNMEDNVMTKIPTTLFSSTRLKNVRLSGNKITSLTVSEKDFLTIQTMDAFIADSTTNCTSGTIKETQGIRFCISTASSEGGSSQYVDSSAESTGSNKILLIGVISGCVVVVILLFLVVRKRSSRAKDDAFVKHTNSAFEDTLSFDHSSQHQSVSSTLLNDPIIITNRIPYNDIKIATCISRGGFGLVYSGTFNRRRVAIKKIRSDINADIKQIEMFLKEICLMASLNHPRIVEFIGVSWDSLRNLCAVTEFMERGDLRDVLQSARARNARLSWDNHKAHIAMHVAEALTYLHSLSPKVIHRDLKSKNILLDSEMTAKLSDFGVSRERRMEESHMTAGIGTAFWIAPEVLLGMDYDERADIFSYGVVLSEIDTEDYPYWNEKNPASGGKQQENVILRMVATGAVRPEFTKSCPQPILELAEACLEVDPNRRPTAAQIVYALQQLIRSSPLTPASSVSPL